MSAAAPLRRSAAVRMPSQAVRAAPAARSRPRLVLVSPHRTTAGRLPFLILIGAIMVSGLVAVLLLHTMAAQYSFRATAMQTKLANLQEQKQALLLTLDHDSSPSELAARAAALGMLPTTTSAFHRLRDGRTIGVQTPVYPPPAPPAKAKSKAKKSTTATKSGTSTKPATGKSATTAGVTPKAGTHSGTGTAGATTTTGATTKTTTTKSGKPTTQSGTTP